MATKTTKTTTTKPAPKVDAIILANALEACRGYASQAKSAAEAHAFGDADPRQALGGIFKGLGQGGETATEARAALAALGPAWAGAEAVLKTGSAIGGWTDPDTYQARAPFYISVSSADEGGAVAWQGVGALASGERHQWTLFGVVPIGSAAEAGMRRAAEAPQALAGWPAWAEPLLAPIAVVTEDGAWALGLALWAKAYPKKAADGSQAPAALGRRPGMDPARACAWPEWPWQQA